MEVFVEKLHVYEKSILKEVLLVIYKGRLNLIYQEKEFFFLRPISIMTDIQCIMKCTMQKYQYADSLEMARNASSLASAASSVRASEIPASLPGFQFLAIELDKSTIKLNNRNHTHIILVQHQNSLENSNYAKLVDFVNYHRLLHAHEADGFRPVREKLVSLDQFFQIREYEQTSNFKFSRIRFSEEDIGKAALKLESSLPVAKDHTKLQDILQI